MRHARHIVLVGPMGPASRTSAACSRCGWNALRGRRCRHRDRGRLHHQPLFDSEGEAGFRTREAPVLGDLLAAAPRSSPPVAVRCWPRRTARRQRRGTVVYLAVQPAVQSRPPVRRRHRPLLRDADAGARPALPCMREPLDREVADPCSTPAACRRRPPRMRRGTTGDPRGPARMSAIQYVEVGGAAPYRIAIGPGLLKAPALLAECLRGRHALVASDGNVAPLYLHRVEAALRRAPDLRLGRLVIPPGEGEKTLGNFAAALDALAGLGATRDACVFALGGGVVGDLAGFAAACWMRGIDVVQPPTTLLAMVDSSVGGKTAVDIPQGKNLVGAFHPPRAVIADTGTLRSLPPRELRAGFARSRQVRRDRRRALPRLAGGAADGLVAGTTPCSRRPSPAAARTRPRSSNATRSNAASAPCSISATPSAMPSKAGRRKRRLRPRPQPRRSGGGRHGAGGAAVDRARPGGEAGDGDRLRTLLARFGRRRRCRRGWMPARWSRACASTEGAGQRLALRALGRRRARGWWPTSTRRRCWPCCDSRKRAPPPASPGAQGREQVPRPGYNCGMRLLPTTPRGPPRPRASSSSSSSPTCWAAGRCCANRADRRTQHLRKDLFADQASAIAALEAARDAQLKRGFQLMFAQGADAPGVTGIPT